MGIDFYNDIKGEKPFLTVNSLPFCSSAKPVKEENSIEWQVDIAKSFLLG